MTTRLGPDQFCQLILSQVSHASSYNLRNSDDYLTIRTYTQLWYRSFVVREWNSLPNSSRNAAILESFKMSLNMVTVNKPPYYYIGERLVSEPNVVH